MKFKSMLSVLVYMYMACLCRKSAQANTDGTIFLERGRRGIVPCPPITSGRVTLEETVAVYWYHRDRDRGSLLISYFRGNVAPQNGIPEGVYDINSEFSLVIENVTASDEGIYLFVVKPNRKMAEDGFVEIYEKVSPSKPFPVVFGCDQRQIDPRQCDVPIDTDVPTRMLRCVIESVKPAVELRWFRVFADGSEEPVYACQTIIPNECTALRNNTFSTSASIELTSANGDVKYKCEAHGVAVRSGSQMTVSFVEVPSTSASVTDIGPKPPENAVTKPTQQPSAVGATVIVLAVTNLISLVANAIWTTVYVGSRRMTRHHDTNSTPSDST